MIILLSYRILLSPEIARANKVTLLPARLIISIVEFCILCFIFTSHLLDDVNA